MQPSASGYGNCHAGPRADFFRSRVPSFREIEARPADRLFRHMELRRLGLAGTRVSSIGVGCNQFGGGVDERGTGAIVRKALDLGVNFFDTAESYSDGRSEEYLGKA